MKIDQFYGNYDLIRGILYCVLPGNYKYKWKRVSVLLLMMQLNVYYLGAGKELPFPSARWYAGMCGCDEKTVDRLVGWLKKEKYAKVRRLRRWEAEQRYQRQVSYNTPPWIPMYPGGFWSTNEIDLRALIVEVRKLLGKALNLKAKNWTVKRVANGVVFKAYFSPSSNGNAAQIWPAEGFMKLEDRLRL